MSESRKTLADHCHKVLPVEVAVAKYTFKLLRQDGLGPITETLDVACDEDAEDLAKVTLLGMAGYTHAEVHLDGRLIAACRRDSCAAMATTVRTRDRFDLNGDHTGS